MAQWYSIRFQKRDGCGFDSYSGQKYGHFLSHWLFLFNPILKIVILLFILAQGHNSVIVRATGRGFDFHYIKIFNISFSRSANEITSRLVEFRHLILLITLNKQCSQRNGFFIIIMECFNTRFPNFVCLPCYVRYTRVKLKKLLFILWDVISRYSINYIYFFLREVRDVEDM